MKKLLPLFLFNLAFFCEISAQNTATKGAVPEQQKKLESLKGTYELRRTGNSRDMFMLPSNLADIIEANRKETTQETIKLNENVLLIILPKNQVANTNH